MPSTLIINLDIEESAETIEKITDDSTYGSIDFRYYVLSSSLREYKFVKKYYKKYYEGYTAILNLQVEYAPQINGLYAKIEPYERDFMARLLHKNYRKEINRQIDIKMVEYYSKVRSIKKEIAKWEDRHLTEFEHDFRISNSLWSYYEECLVMGDENEPKLVPFLKPQGEYKEGYFFGDRDANCPDHVCRILKPAEANKLLTKAIKELPKGLKRRAVQLKKYDPEWQTDKEAYFDYPPKDGTEEYFD